MNSTLFSYEGGVLNNYMQGKLSALLGPLDSSEAVVDVANWVGRSIALTYVEYEYEAAQDGGGYVYFVDISRMRSTITAITISVSDSIALEVGGTWTLEIDAIELRNEEYRATLRSISQKNEKEYHVCSVRLLH
jgi:hypothetical protein